MSVRLMAVGDIALRAKPEGRDPFEFVKETLGEADLVFGNLEVPLTNAREPVEEKAESLCAPVEQGSYLSAANFSVVNLANIHIGDYGPDGVLETIDSLQRAYELLPVRIRDDSRPRPITDEAEAAAFRAHVDLISRVLVEGMDTWWWFGEIGGPYLSGNLKAFGIRIRRHGFGHAIAMVRWLTGRFAPKCYVGMIRRQLRRRV